MHYNTNNNNNTNTNTTTTNNNNNNKITITVKTIKKCQLNVTYRLFYRGVQGLSQEFISEV